LYTLPFSLKISEVLFFVSRASCRYKESKTGVGTCRIELITQIDLGGKEWRKLNWEKQQKSLGEVWGWVPLKLWRKE
jgi:hypothetical protein